MSILPQELETIIYKYNHEILMNNVTIELKERNQFCMNCFEKRMNMNHHHCHYCRSFICNICYKGMNRAFAILSELARRAERSEMFPDTMSPDTYGIECEHCANHGHWDYDHNLLEDEFSDDFYNGNKLQTHTHREGDLKLEGIMADYEDNSDSDAYYDELEAYERETRELHYVSREDLQHSYNCSVSVNY